MRNEKFVDEYIKALNESDGIALDIGANHGIYTVQLADKFSKVYAFEPHPDNLSIIKNELGEKNKTNVEVLQKVIGYEDGISTLFINRLNHGGHTIMSDLAEHGKWGHKSDNTITVESTTLDSFCADKEVSFIKCDIEGGEYEIFFYADKMLKNSNPVIILETHQVANFNVDQNDRDHLQKHFDSFGYNIYDVNGRKVDRMDCDTHYVVKKG